MGNLTSSETKASEEDIWWNPQTPSNNAQQMASNTNSETSKSPAKDFDEFSKEFERDCEKRRAILAAKKEEFQTLRKQLSESNDEKEKMQREIFNYQKEIEQLKLENLKLQTPETNADELKGKNKELIAMVAEMQLDIQNLNSELFNIEQERLEYSKHITALKDVVKVTKNMLEIRESQIEGLKVKVKSVEDMLSSKEMKIMSDGLREEYEKQLRNIRHLRALYEERQRLDRIDKEHLELQVEEAKKLVEEKEKICMARLERIEELEADNSKKYETIMSVQSNLGLSKAECSELKAEIDIINQLFSQILLGFNNTQEIDLDKLIKLLEENHELLTNIAANEESNSTAAALPKVLLDLINEINNERYTNKEITDENVAANQISSPQVIVETLPKVWRVLIELLSHHRERNPPITQPTEKNPCYVSEETPSGPKLKISVSQTFIRLKDLILEKRYLEREKNRLKHLNTHLMRRLDDQESRISFVSGELTKTWRVVDKLQRQHQQLHTHEKVLRYELREKRKLLANLKDELECCREMWVRAREKNDNTQAQWTELRQEFSDRKANDYFNQSVESGYSDDKEDTSEDEQSYESDDCEIKTSDEIDPVKFPIDVAGEELEEQDEASSQKTDFTAEVICRNVLEELVTESTEIAVNFPISTASAKQEQQNQDEGGFQKTDLAVEVMCKELLEELVTQSTERKQTGAVRKTIKSDVTACSDRLERKECASTSRNCTQDELLAAREARLKRLEEESQKLFSKVTKTNLRSCDISNKLDSLHEMYGEPSSNSSNSSDKDKNADGN